MTRYFYADNIIADQYVISQKQHSLEDPISPQRGLTILNLRVINNVPEAVFRYSGQIFQVKRWYRLIAGERRKYTTALLFYSTEP